MLGDGAEPGVIGALSAPAEPFKGPEGEMNVYHGTVRIPVRVHRTGPVTGRPRIMLTYQACDDKICLAPETERGPGAILTE